MCSEPLVYTAAANSLAWPKISQVSLWNTSQAHATKGSPSGTKHGSYFNITAALIGSERGQEENDRVIFPLENSGAS